MPNINVSSPRNLPWDSCWSTASTSAHPAGVVDAVSSARYPRNPPGSVKIQMLVASVPRMATPRSTSSDAMRPDVAAVGWEVVRRVALVVMVQEGSHTIVWPSRVRA